MLEAVERGAEKEAEDLADELLEIGRLGPDMRGLVALLAVSVAGIISASGLDALRKAVHP